jgi:hypothetical protein
MTYPNMKNPNIGMGEPMDYKWGNKGVPTRDNCDPTNPREFALWAFTALPGVNGAPLMLPPDFFMAVSEHLWELGFRHVEEPIKKWRPPAAHDPHWATSPGQWVPLDTPDPPQNPGKKAWDSLSPQQKAEIYELARAEHENDPQ